MTLENQGIHTKKRTTSGQLFKRTTACSILHELSSTARVTVEKSHRACLVALKELFLSALGEERISSLEEAMDLREAADYGSAYTSRCQKPDCELKTYSKRPEVFYRPDREIRNTQPCRLIST